MNAIDEKLSWKVPANEAAVIRSLEWPEDDAVKIRLFETAGFFSTIGKPHPSGLSFENALISDVLEFLRANDVDAVQYNARNHGVNDARRFSRNLVLYGCDWVPRFHIQIDELETALLTARHSWILVNPPRPLLCNLIIDDVLEKEWLRGKPPQLQSLFTHRIRPDGSGEEMPMFKRRNLHGSWPEEVNIHTRGEWNEQTQEYEPGVVE